MKLMTRLLLIHWHYFTHEVVEFDKLNFLTGKNASGKSTIIDAIQLVLLGDTSGSYFNKAANGRSTRTLSGYLRGELGDDEDQGFKYLRNGRFTSYIALEFFDEEKKRFFTEGCCFDTYGENDMQKLFFSYDGKFPENEFLSGRTPMSIAELRMFMKNSYSQGHSYTTNVGRDFRTHLYGKLGGLREQFGQLLKKAVSFDPDVEIQSFISDFVCNVQRTVDVSGMQDNIRNYKNLEAEVVNLQNQISFLDEICKIYENFVVQQKKEKRYTYLIDKANADIKAADLEQAKTKKAGMARKYEMLDKQIKYSQQRAMDADQERDRLKLDLDNDRNEREIKRISQMIEEKKREAENITDKYGKNEAWLSECISLWRVNTNRIIDKILKIEIDDGVINSFLEDLHTECNVLLKLLETTSQFTYKDIVNIGSAGLNAYVKKANDIKERARDLKLRAEEKEKYLLDTRKKLEEEKQSLEQGIYHFPKSVSDLKEAIKSRLRVLTGKDIGVYIAAEAAEIKDNRWRNVIEGYMNTQKFYIIVAPEYFKRAIEIFDEIKRRDKLYGTGLVDIKRMRRKNPSAEKGSLAEEIETEIDEVRVFYNYVLGRVHKCDTITELRNYNTAVTDEGVLYRSFVVRAINPDLWAKPAIGQEAIRERLERVKEELRDTTNQIASCALIKQAASFVENFKVVSERELSECVFSAGEMLKVSGLRNEINILISERDAVDRSTIDELRSRIAAIEAELENIRKQIGEDNKELGGLDIELRRYEKEVIPLLEQEKAQREEKLINDFEEDWVENVGYPIYEKEMLKRGGAAQIDQAFGRELTKAVNAKQEELGKLHDKRRDYNNIYKMGYDINAADNAVYEQAFSELKNNRLPDYTARIEDSRKKAFEQFREDFLSRLQYNIEDAKRQIKRLNEALSGYYFGEDSYKFRIIPKQEYKHLYDMIVDPMLLEGGYNLFSEQFNIKYKNEIDELFSMIASDSILDTDYEKRVRKFTDYRTYLSFDLEVTNKEGEVQRLSKTMGKKSGGETQTPFYIAVLASFAQLYRVERNGLKTTARLIIFDEAFSKMDSERIVKSIDLLRKFDFQVILSAPPDKIGDIAVLVDKDLCVTREGKKAYISEFTPKHIEEMINGL